MGRRAAERRDGVRRPLLSDRTEPLLVGNHAYRIRLVAQGRRIQYWVDGRLLFDHVDNAPYTGGWFALRTVASHFAVRDYRVWRAPVH